MGLADIHIHLLFGVDDGAKDEDEMHAILDAAYQAGTRVLCCTPHMCWWTSRKQHLKKQSEMAFMHCSTQAISPFLPMWSAIDPCTEEFLRFKRSGTMAWCSKQILSPCSAGLAYLFSVNAGSCCPLG